MTGSRTSSVVSVLQSGRISVIVALTITLAVGLGALYWVTRSVPDPSPVTSAPIDAGAAPATAEQAPNATVASEAAAPVAEEPVALVSSETTQVEDPGQAVGLRGKVLDLQSQPLVGALVRWFPAPGDLHEVRHDGRYLRGEFDLAAYPAKLRDLHAQSRHTHTDANGQYALDVARAGCLLVQIEGYELGWRDLSSATPRVIEQVAEGASWIPVADGEVNAAFDDATGGETLASDATQTEPVASAPATGVAMAPGEMGNQAHGTVDFRLGSGGSIRGTVVDAHSRAPVASIEVRGMPALTDQPFWAAMDVGSRTAIAAIAGVDGGYHLFGLPPQELLLFVTPGTSEHVADPDQPHRKVLLEIGQNLEGIDLRAVLGGTISGQVRQVSGAPAIGAKIGVVPSDIMQTMMRMDASTLMALQRQVETDAGGRFHYGGLVLGKLYTVAVHAPDHATWLRSGIELEAKQRHVELAVDLQRGSSVHGVVVDEQGRPTPDMSVFALPVTGDDEIGRLEMMISGMGPGHDMDAVTSEADGSFTLSRLRAGTYNLIAGRGWGGQSRDRNRPIEVDGMHDVHGMQLVVPVAEADLATAEGLPSTLSGVVLDDRNLPVSKVRVSATARNQVTTVTTDEAGAFTLEVRGDGPFTVQATTARPQGETLRNVPPGRRDLVIVVERSATISGVVTLPGGIAPGSAFGVETRHVGEAGARRRLEQMFTSTTEGTRGNPDGTFTIENLTPGSVEVLATVPGYAPTSSGVIELAPGAIQNDLRIEVQRGATLSGKVVLDGGAEVAGARVSVISEDEDPALRALRLWMPATGGGETTDERGFYEVSRLAPGTYRVMAQHPDYAQSEPVTVTVSADEVLALAPLRLSLGGSIATLVTRDGKPRPGIMVQLMSTASAMQMATSDAAGSATFKGLPPGVYVLQFMDMADAAGGGSLQMRMRHVTLAGNEAVELDLDLHGGYMVSGKLTGMTHGSTASILVRRPGGPGLETLDPTEVEQQIDAARFLAGMTMLQGDGEYEIRGLEPGEYLLEVPFMPEDPFDLEAIRAQDRSPSYRATIEIRDKDLKHDIRLR